MDQLRQRYYLIKVVIIYYQGADLLRTLDADSFPIGFSSWQMKDCVINYLMNVYAYSSHLNILLLSVQAIFVLVFQAFLQKFLLWQFQMLARNLMPLLKMMFSNRIDLIDFLSNFLSWEVVYLISFKLDFHLK